SGADLLDGGEGSDTYAVWGINDGYDTYRDTGKAGWDKILATASGTIIGLSNTFSAASSGIEEISGGGYSNVGIRGTTGGDFLDFSGIKLTDITKIYGD